MRKLAFLIRKSSEFRPILIVPNHYATPSFYLGNGTLFTIGFPHNGFLHKASIVIYFITKTPIIVPAYPMLVLRSLLVIARSLDLPVFVPLSPKSMMLAVLVI